MPAVQQIMETCGEFAMVGVAMFLRQLIQLLRGSDAMGRQPTVPPGTPVIEHPCRQGICQSRGDKIGRAPLPPMRKVPPVAAHLLVWIERFKGHNQGSDELQLVLEDPGVNRDELKLWTTFQQVTKPFAKSCGRASTQAVMSSGLNQAPQAISSGRQRTGPS